MDRTLIDTIDRHGDPLAFKLRQGSRSPLLQGGHDVIKVEARQMAMHQKEAVITDGAEASAWRVTTDEGKHPNDTDLAPFLLGFFNAGIQIDLAQQISRIAAERGPASSRSISGSKCRAPAISACSAMPPAPVRRRLGSLCSRPVSHSAT
jgi:hypothetical protein